MRFSLKIARRYLFGKKSTNAINVISGISVTGIAVGSMALILVSSVFNGFEDLIRSLYSSFDPEAKVQLVEGKVFSPDTTQMRQIYDLEGVEYVAETLEEIAFFEYRNNQVFGVIKGVDEQFVKVTSIDSTIREGAYSLADGERNLAVVGAGMRNNLQINVEDYFEPMGVYMPKRKGNSAIGKPFKKRIVYPVGTFVIQQKFDEQYILTNIDFVRELLSYRNGEVSSLEIKFSPDVNADALIDKIQNILGDQFDVQSQYEQNQSLLKLMNVEKWLGFAIISLTTILVGFTLFGSLLMIVIDKRKDISILKSMGATPNNIRNIFLSLGYLLSFFGMAIGFVIALLFYFAQKQFQLIKMEGFIVEAYPISIRWIDFAAVIVFMLIFAFLFSIAPANKAARVRSIILDE